MLKLMFNFKKIDTKKLINYFTCKTEWSSVVDINCIKFGKICSIYNGGNGLIHDFLIKTVINSTQDYNIYIHIHI